jgi:5-methylcytosine-specific restriction enzyme subunit McrC
MKICWLPALEHRPVDQTSDSWGDVRKFLEQVWEKSDKEPKEIPETLGLHNDQGGKLRASHFVGRVWVIPGQTAMKVDPKGPPDLPDSETWDVDYFDMLLACLQDVIVSRQVLDGCVDIWLDQPPLPAQDDASRLLTIFVVSMYLRELNELCKRHVRRNFMATQENLIGRVKGRILVTDNLRRNISRGRLDRVSCRFQVHSLDTRENQILRAALEQSMRYVGKHAQNYPVLGAWARTAASTLADVRLRRIHGSDFQGIRYAGLMKPYKTPHKLAQAVLFLLGSDPTVELGDLDRPIPPFAIDMDELFERYCEAWLRKCEKWRPGLWAGYKKKENNLGEVFKVRPDFLSAKNMAILDAKYKYDWKEETRNPDGTLKARDDVLQLLGYSRHRFVLDELRCYEPDGLYILYPTVVHHTAENQDSFKPTRVFQTDIRAPFYTVPVPLRLRPKPS